MCTSVELGFKSRPPREPQLGITCNYCPQPHCTLRLLRACAAIYGLEYRMIHYNSACLCRYMLSSQEALLWPRYAHSLSFFEIHFFLSNSQFQRIKSPIGLMVLLHRKCENRSYLNMWLQSYKMRSAMSVKSIENPFNQSCPTPP